jgi:hypothetical protein
MDARNREVD